MRDLAARNARFDQCRLSCRPDLADRVECIGVFVLPLLLKRLQRYSGNAVAKRRRDPEGDCAAVGPSLVFDNIESVRELAFGSTKRDMYVGHTYDVCRSSDGGLRSAETERSRFSVMVRDDDAAIVRRDERMKAACDDADLFLVVFIDRKQRTQRVQYDKYGLMLLNGAREPIELLAASIA